MNKTGIEYLDYTWNPVTGCTPISEGCDNCWAQGLLERRKFPPGVTLYPERLYQPLKRKKPSIIGVCFMGDLFHKDVPLEFIRQVFQTMMMATQHTFIVLTKRPENIAQFLIEWKHDYVCPLSNVWFGVTVENNDRLNERWPVLAQIPAAKRFISYEPALGPLDFDGSVIEYGVPDLVIGGCESGLKRRTAEIDWFRNLRDQCDCGGMNFFLKQMEVNGKVVSRPELDGKIWNEWPTKA